MSRTRAELERKFANYSHSKDADWPKFLDTLCSITPSKGMHYFFKYPKDGIGSNAGIVGKGIDIRGDGGYVVLPPSPGYHWELDHDYTA